MKTIKSLFFLFFIINYSFNYSQENSTNSIIESISKDALYKEKVFVHINKTIYLIDENIWFTAYVAKDKNNSPSNYTTTLHVNLLNQKGDIIDSKNVFIKDGVGIGDFSIDNNYQSGKYYIQGFTNYMKNFGIENVFIQEIEIINPLKKNIAKQKEYTNSYDLQVFPESGYLLEDTHNTIGIKAMINGRGFPFSGKIINSEGLEITTFKGNSFGMSKCEFHYQKNEIYTAIISINNTIQKISLPKANKTGIIFNLENTTDKNYIKLTLKTNKKSLPILIGQKLTLLFYRNNVTSEAVNLTLKNSSEMKQELFFSKSKLMHGINIVTLFKNNQPIAERKFFIDKQIEQTSIIVEKLKTVNDSLYFKIETLNSDFQPVPVQLSISVLPKKTNAFYETQNIKSAFLLSPYVKGRIENPSFYFKNINPKEKKYLDLLLLNQGWNTYSLEEKIREINPKEQFEFERGFTLNGKIKKVNKKYKIGVLSKNKRLISYSNIDENGEFSFENIFAYKNDSIHVALIKKNNLLVKPINITFLDKTSKKENFKSFIDKYYPPVSHGKISASKAKNKSHETYRGYPNIGQLNEIILKNVKSKKEKTIYDLERNIAFKHNVLAPGFYKNKKVTEIMELNFLTLFSYFQSLGFIKKANGQTYISLRNAPMTIFPSKSSNPDHTFPPHIYIDDVSTNKNGDIEILQGLSMKYVDEVLINRSGAGGGATGAGGIIKIYLKKGNHQNSENESQNLYETLILKTGFDKATDYFKPMDYNYTKNTYSWFQIDWSPSVKTNKNGEVFFTIPANEFSDEFQFIINGFSENGLLFNTIFNTGLPDF